MQGKIFCLDGSPTLMEANLKLMIQNMTEDQQQNQLLAHMYQVMTHKTQDITPILEEQKSWDDKLSTCLDELKGKLEEPFEYQKLILQTAYKRVIQSKEYTISDGKLKSEIVLLRATKGVSLPKTYDLDKITTKPIAVYDLNSTHLSAPYDLRCSDIINRELDLDKSTVQEAIARLNKLNSSIDGRMIR